MGDGYKGHKYSVIQVFQLCEENGEIMAIALNKKVVALGLDNGNIEAYQIEEKKSQKILTNDAHRGSVVDIHFSPLGSEF